MSLPKGYVQNLTNEKIMKSPFAIFQMHPDDYHSFIKKSSNNTQKDPILSKLFFHPKNIKLLQKQIIATIFHKTNKLYLIEEQNENDLRTIMHHILSQNNDIEKHDQHNQHNQYNKILQNKIKQLNYLVIKEVIPGIIVEIKSYLGYLDRAFGETKLMDRPVNVSTSGNRTLPNII